MPSKFAFAIPIFAVISFFGYGAYLNSAARTAATEICAVAKSSQSAAKVQTFVSAQYPRKIRVSNYAGKITLTAGGIGMYRAYCRLVVNQDEVRSSSVDFVWE